MIELWVPKAATWLNSNKTIRNHGQRAAYVLAWKNAGATAVRLHKPPQIEKARIVVELVKEPGGGRWDPANWYPTAKAVLDGMVQAGMLPDDDHKHVIGPDMRHGGTSKTDPGLRIHVLPYETASRGMEMKDGGLMRDELNRMQDEIAALRAQNDERMQELHLDLLHLAEQLRDLREVTLPALENALEDE